MTAALQPTGTAEPELVRVSILGGDTQLDLALPTAIPLVALMPDVVSLLRLPAPPVDDPGQITELPRWSLARVGGPPLPTDSTLAAAAVRDGELLVIHRDTLGAPGAVVDDVGDHLAQLTAETSPAFDADAARRLGAAVTVAAALVAVIAGRLAVDAALPVAIVSATVAVVSLAAAILGARWGAGARNVCTLSIVAYLTAGLAGSFVPQLDPSASGAMQLAAAGCCALVVALLAHRCTGAGPGLHAGLATVAALVAVGGPAGAPITATLGLVVIVLAARIAIAASRLPLPPVPITPPPPPQPDAPGIVDGLDAVTAIADLALTDLHDLRRRAELVNAYLTGITTGAAAVTALAAATVAVSFDGSLPSLLYAGAVAAVLLARGRTHAGRTQSTVLIASGVLVGVAVLAGSGSPAVLFGGALALTAAAFIIGATAGSHQASPLQRRWLELADYALIATVVPLLLWLLDAYRLIREL